MHNVGDLPEPEWLTAIGPRAGVAIATRCRVARNLAGSPFPWRCDAASAAGVAREVLAHLRLPGDAAAADRALHARDLSPGDLRQLVEWRYASAHWAEHVEHRWLIVARDARLSVMVNEEDHLRFQAILPGLQVESVMQIAEAAARDAEQSLAFARHPAIGYATASPGNAGTGVRVGVMLHLPALAASGELASVLVAAERIGCTVRGLYGEGSRGTGALFQLSYLRTVGASAAEAGQRTQRAVLSIAEAEARARASRYGTDRARAALHAVARRTIDEVLSVEQTPDRLLRSVSLLRLAIAERVIAGDLCETSHWIALCGNTASEHPADRPSTRFEAVRRSAGLRLRIRNWIGTGGMDCAV